MVKKIVGTGVLLVLALALQAGVKMYTLKSPDGKVKLEVTAGQVPARPRQGTGRRRHQRQSPHPDDAPGHKAEAPRYGWSRSPY